MVLVLEGEVQLDEEGVLQHKHHLFLATDVLHLLLTDDVTLLKNLHCSTQGTTCW